MSTPEHRASSGSRVGPRLLIVLVFVVGALVGAGIAGLVAVGLDRSAADESTDPGAPAAATPSSAQSTPSASPSPTGPAPDKAEEQAKRTKPLADLEPGDRVVYNMSTCRFRDWVLDDRSVALIDCPGGPPFEVKTEFLVPVEPAPAD